jgi:transposase
MDLRQRIVAAYAEGGATQEQVAERFGVGVASVVRLWARHRSGKGLEARSIPGRPARVTEAVEAELQVLLDEEPDLPRWMYAERLQERTGVSVSTSTVGRVLKKLGYTKKKKQ